MVIDMRRCDGCKDCTVACQDTHELPKTFEWIKVFEVKDKQGRGYFMPRPCMQCESAPCLRVCPVAATFKTDEGVILVDQDRCIGCRMCMAACPYGARYFNYADPPVPNSPFAHPTPEYPVPQQKGTVGKCMFCVHNTVDGKLPACVNACGMGALYIGDLVADVATNSQGETVRLSTFLKENDAFRYKEELGTGPRVYYIAGHGQLLDY
jgi:molybdopterin-containing oxidoreductase family iron-sulfur binding subunit